MSITKKRSGNSINSTLSNTKFPHDRLYPSYFIVLSNQVDNYIDFKYVFNIYDENGLIGTYETAPSTDKYGVFDSNKYVNDILNTVEYSATPSSYKMMQEYKVSVQEYYSNSLQGSATYFDKSQLSLRKDNYNGSKYPYTYKELYQVIMSNGIGKKLRQSKDTTANISIGTPPYSDFVWLEVMFENGIKWKYKYYLIDTYEFDDADSTAYDANESGNLIPAGYATLDSTSIETYGYTDTSGTWHSSVTTITGITDVSNANTPTTIYMYSPHNISDVIQWDVSECSNNTVTVHWLNYYGGYEFYNFNMDRTDTVTQSAEIYESEEVDSLLFPDNSKANKRVLLDKENYQFELYTDFLTDDEIVYMSDLWLSDKVYLDIDGVQLPVIVTDRNREVYKENKGLYQFKITLLYAVS